MSAETTFLHDIASPLTTARLNLENSITVLEDRNPENFEKCLRMLNSSLKQLKRVSEMIEARRAQIAVEGA